MRRTVSIVAALLLAAGSAQAQDAANGKAVYDKWCVICHGDDVPSSGGGTATLATLYAGTEIPEKLEDRTDLTAAFLTAMVRQSRANMPNFRFTEISRQELEDLIAYLTRNNPQ